MTQSSQMNAAGEWEPVMALPLDECGVVVTGGTSGVGLAAAQALGAAGARRIVLIGRNEERGAKARAAVLERTPDIHVEFISADANDPERATWAGEKAIQLIGNVDVLVNSSVGDLIPGLFHDMPIEDILHTLIHLAAAPLHMCRVLLPGMRERNSGVIINIASDAAKMPTPGEAVIGGGMAAIVRFSNTLAMEAKRYGVRVNTITPSLVGNTGSYGRVKENEFSSALFAKAARAAHLGLAQPEDLAALIVFLASPAAARITGQTISVNGGISAI